MPPTTFDYTVQTNQVGVHPGLVKLVQKHAERPFVKPISQRQRQAFTEISAWIAETDAPLILDCGCGRGESSWQLAQRYPAHRVIGIDKSRQRLSAVRQSIPNNLRYVCADLVSFWQQAYRMHWPISAVFCFYPNPWPKSSQIKRRWHGHPIFPYLLSLSPYFEIRSNWLIYLEEMQQAASLLGVSGRIEKLLIEQPISAFERKYHANQVDLYQLRLVNAENT